MVGNPDRNESENIEKIPSREPSPEKKITPLRLPMEWNITKWSLPGIFCITNPKKKRVFFGEADNHAWLQMHETFEYLEDETFEGNDELSLDYKNAGGRGAFDCKVLASSLKYEDPSERLKALEECRDNFLKDNQEYTVYQVNAPRAARVHDIRDITSTDIEATEQEDN